MIPKLSLPAKGRAVYLALCKEDKTRIIGFKAASLKRSMTHGAVSNSLPYIEPLSGNESSAAAERVRCLKATALQISGCVRIEA